MEEVTWAKSKYLSKAHPTIMFVSKSVLGSIYADTIVGGAFDPYLDFAQLTSSTFTTSSSSRIYR